MQPKTGDEQMSEIAKTDELPIDKKIKVLVIDDDDVDRMSLARAMGKTGFNIEIQETRDAQSGLAALETEHFDCIFLDYQLPGKDGLELLEEIVALEKSTPVIMMTGQGDEQLAVKILQGGAADYLTKDMLSPETVTRRLRTVIRVAEAEKERKAAQARLSDMNARLHYLIDNNPAITYSTVPTGDFKITYISDNLKIILGYEAEEVLGDLDFWIDHVHPEDMPSLWQRLPTLMSKGTQESLDYRFKHKEGHYLWMHDTLRMLRDDEGNPVEMLGSLLDISKRKEIEAELIAEKDEQRELIGKLQEARDQALQSEKMAAIGQLAAGVAHEINNPTGYINSNLCSLERYVEDLIELIQLYQVAESVLEEQFPDLMRLVKAVRERIDLEFIKEDIRSLVQESREGANRVKQIVQDLKDFSHLGEAVFRTADIHKGLDSTLNIVHNELKYKAVVTKKYGTLPQVECIYSQLNQVFMNILVNAAHAIEKQGEIVIRTGEKNEEIWIEISDNGKGIPEEKLSRIFDPFFTTKAVGVGTGLGLSLSYGIINKHGGRIDVESEVGKGTQFTIWLPIQQKKA